MVGAPSFPPGAPGRRRILLPGARPTRKSTLTDRSLILWWTFDGPGLNGTSVIDQSGNGVTGTLINGPTLVQGKVGGGISTFAGSAQNIQSAATFAHGIGTGDFTWSVWINKVSAPITYSPCLNNGNFAPCLYNALTAANWGLYDNADLPSGNALPLGRWAHLVAVRSGTTVTYYQDGVKTPLTGTSSGNMANAVFAVGTDNTSWATESYDDVRVYKRALSAAEVRMLYNGPGSDLIQPIDKIWARMSAAASSGRTGTLAKTLAALTSSATGTVLVSGSATPTLSNLTASSAGTVLVQGASTPTIAALTTASTGTVLVSGTSTPTLAALTAASTGTVLVSGTSTPTIAAITSSSTGTVLDTGVLSSTIAALTLSSTGTTPNVAVASPTIGNLTLGSAGTVLVSGTATPTLAAITSSSAGTVLVTGTLAQTIDAITLVSAGTVAATGSRTGSFAQTIDPITSSATGTVLVKGTTSSSVGAITLSTTGTVTKPASVKTIGATGCDYTTIEAWAASLSGWIFGGDQEGVLKGEVFTPSNSFSFTGFTTSPTARLIIRCSTDVETLGNTKFDGVNGGVGARVTKTGGGGIGIISITDDNIKHWVVRGLELYSNGADNPGVFCNNAGFDAGLVDSCYVHHVGANAYDMSAATGVGVARVLNSAAQEIGGNNVGILGVSGHTDRVSADFCTLVRHVNSLPNTGCGVRYVVARNTYAGLFGTNGSGFNDFSDLGTGSSNYASNDLTGSTSALQIVRPSELFLSSGSVWDLILSQLPNRLVGQGTPLTGVTTDAVGTTRNNPDPDIGWYELPDRGDFNSFFELDTTLGNLTSSSTGTVKVKGTLSQTLDNLTLSSTGTGPSLSVTGTLDATIANLTLSAPGTVLDTGTLSATLAAITSASTGTVLDTGYLVSSMGNLAFSTAGTVLVTGSLSTTIANLASVSAVSTDTPVTLTKTLANLTVVSAGNVYTPVTLDQTLADLTSSSAGAVRVAGAVASTFDAITVASTGTVRVTGTLSSTIAALTSSSTGTVRVTGSVAKTLANLTSTSAVSTYTPVVLVKTIPALTLSSAGKVRVTGTGVAHFSDLTSNSGGKVLVKGALNKTIGPFRLHTRVIHPNSGSSDRYYLHIPRFNIDHPPSSDDLTGHLLEKLRQQQQWLDALSDAALQSANTPPLNPRYGTLRYAVGDWAATLGAVGLYIFKESGWTLIS